MSFLEQATISESTCKGAFFGVLAGPPGSGKTWLCRFAPKPFYIALEEGVNHLSGVGRWVDKGGKLMIPASVDDLFAALKYFLAEDRGYRTIIIDSARPINDLFEAQVIKDNPTEVVKNKTIKIENIGDYMFGSGHEKVLAYWHRLVAGIKAINRKNINVILICHTTQRTAADVDNNEYKKNVINLTKWGNIDIGQMLFAASTWTYFIRSEAQTTEKKAFIGTKTVASDSQKPLICVYTRSRASFDAKVWVDDISKIPDFYIIDIEDDSTSKIIFEDLTK